MKKFNDFNYNNNGNFIKDDVKVTFTLETEDDHENPLYILSIIKEKLKDEQLFYSNLKVEINDNIYNDD